MRTYTEEEVAKLLETQRGNCWVALHSLTKDEGMLNVVIKAPEPGTWRNKKQYFAVFESLFQIDLQSIPVDYSESDWKEALRELSLIPLTFSAEKETKTIDKVKVEISKEIKDFLFIHCNIERNVVGEDTYILNNLRFKIEEE